MKKSWSGSHGQVRKKTDFCHFPFSAPYPRVWSTRRYIIWHTNPAAVILIGEGHVNCCGFPKNGRRSLINFPTPPAFSAYRAV